MEVIMPHYVASSSSGSDVSLSRRKLGFDSPWGYEMYVLHKTQVYLTV